MIWIINIKIILAKNINRYVQNLNSKIFLRPQWCLCFIIKYSIVNVIINMIYWIIWRNLKYRC